MRRGKNLPTIVRIANPWGRSSRVGSGDSRRLEQAGAIAPLERGAKLRQIAKCEWWGDEDLAVGVAQRATERHPDAQPAPNRSE
jgi:hypothetical protein